MATRCYTRTPLLVAESLEKAPTSVGILVGWDRVPTRLQSMSMMVAVVSRRQRRPLRSLLARTAAIHLFVRRLASAARVMLRKLDRQRSPPTLGRERRTFPKPTAGASRLARLLV